jgi:hypothetical protein
VYVRGADNALEVIASVRTFVARIAPPWLRVEIGARVLFGDHHPVHSDKC